MCSSEEVSTCASGSFFFHVIAGWVAQTDSIELPAYVRLTWLFSFREDWRGGGPGNQNTPPFTGWFTSVLERCLKPLYRCNSCNQDNVVVFFVVAVFFTFSLLCRCFPEAQAECWTGIYLNIPWMKADNGPEACALNNNVTVINSCNSKTLRNKTCTAVFQFISWNNFWNFRFWFFFSTLPTRAHLQSVY